MADEIKLDALLAKQKEMAALAALMIDEKDADRLQAMAAQLQAMAAELQAMALTLEAQMPETVRRGYTEVVLTAAQRERVEAATGVALQSITISDPAGVSTRTMPHTDPRVIEYYAMREGRKRKAAEEAEVILRAELDAAVAAIESQGTPAVQAQLDELRADPKFMGGLLQKK